MWIWPLATELMELMPSVVDQLPLGWASLPNFRWLGWGLDATVKGKGKKEE